MCTYDDANVVLCMPVCSAADALVVAAGCCWDIRVHFAAAVLPEAQTKLHLCINVLSSYFQCFNYIMSCPSTQFYLLM